MKLKAIVKEENSSEKVNSCREASFVRQPYLNVKRVHIGPQGKKAFGGPDQKCFDHYAFYVGYSITNVFYIAINAAKGVWGLSPKYFHNNIPYNAGVGWVAKLSSQVH